MAFASSITSAASSFFGMYPRASRSHSSAPNSFDDASVMEQGEVGISHSPPAPSIRPAPEGTGLATTEKIPTISKEAMELFAQLFPKNWDSLGTGITGGAAITIQHGPSKAKQWQEQVNAEIAEKKTLPVGKELSTSAFYLKAADITARLRKNPASVSKDDLAGLARDFSNLLGIAWKERTKAAAYWYPLVSVPSNIIGLLVTMMAARASPSTGLGMMSGYSALAFMPLFLAHNFVFQAQFRVNKKSVKVTSDSVKSASVKEVADKLPEAVKRLEEAIENIPEDKKHKDYQLAMERVDSALDEVTKWVAEGTTVEAKFGVEQAAVGNTTLVRVGRAIGSLGAALTGYFTGDPKLGSYLLAGVVVAQTVAQIFASIPDTWQKQQAQLELALRTIDFFKEAQLEVPDGADFKDEDAKKFVDAMCQKLLCGPLEARVGFVANTMREKMRALRQEVGRTISVTRSDCYIRMRELSAKETRTAEETDELNALTEQLAKAASDTSKAATIQKLVEESDIFEADLKHLQGPDADWDKLSDEGKKILEEEFAAYGDTRATLSRIFSAGMQTLKQPEMSVPLAINKVVQTLTLVLGGPTSPQLVGAIVRQIGQKNFVTATALASAGAIATMGAFFGPFANTHTVQLRCVMKKLAAEGLLDLPVGWRAVFGSIPEFVRQLPSAILAQAFVWTRMRGIKASMKRATFILSAANAIRSDTGIEAASVKPGRASVPGPDDVAGDTAMQASGPIMRGALPAAAAGSNESPATVVAASEAGGAADVTGAPLPPGAPLSDTGSIRLVDPSVFAAGTVTPVVISVSPSIAAEEADEERPDIPRGASANDPVGKWPSGLPNPPGAGTSGIRVDGSRPLGTDEMPSVPVAARRRPEQVAGLATVSGGSRAEEPAGGMRRGKRLQKRRPRVPSAVEPSGIAIAAAAPAGQPVTVEAVPVPAGEPGSSQNPGKEKGTKRQAAKAMLSRLVHRSRPKGATGDGDQQAAAVPAAEHRTEKRRDRVQAWFSRAVTAPLRKRAI